MVNFDRARVTLSSSARNINPEKSADLKDRREVGRAHESERVKMRLETFVESSEWQAELQRRIALLHKLESMMLRKDVVPLSKIQTIWKLGSERPEVPEEQRLNDSDSFADPPVALHKSIGGLVWETTDGKWFRLDETGQPATLDEDGLEVSLQLDETALVRPVYPESTHKQWSELFNDYKIVQPFPQLYRLENVLPAEQYLNDMGELRQRWVEMISGWGFEVSDVLEGALYNIRLPGFEIHTTAVGDEKNFGWQTEIHPPEFTPGLTSEQLLRFIRGEDPQLTADNEELLRYQLADMDMVMRKLDEWTKSGDMFDVVLQESRFGEVVVPVKFLRLSEELKQKTGKGTVFRQTLGEHVWRLVDQGVANRNMLLRYSYGTWYSAGGEYPVLNTDVLYVMDPWMTWDNYKRASDLLESEHPFLQQFIDTVSMQIESQGYDALEYSEELKRRNRVIERFLTRIPEETKKRIYNGTLGSDIPTPKDKYIPPQLRRGQLQLPRNIFSNAQNEEWRSAKSTITNEGSYLWQSQLMMLSWLGEFDPRTIDLT